MEKIRVGVFGAGRGSVIARNLRSMESCEVVALCDFNEERRNTGLKRLNEGVVGYDNFDEFLNHGLDAVILANYFHEHAPYAIKCFEKGIHVYSECISNSTMAEGVELIRAFEKSNSIYMLAENYPNMIFNREMKRICDGGTLGRILYAEGEYNHPGDPADTSFKKTYNYFEKHWRNYCPRTYYVTHSLAPIMWATGATPRQLSAFSVYAPPTDPDCPTASHVADEASVILTQNDDGSIFRFTGCAKFGAHHNFYRVCGTNGQIENPRGMGGRVMLRYNEWNKPEGACSSALYDANWNDPDEKFIRQSGHGGGDYLSARMFIECIQAGKQPEHPFDIYSAVTMSSVAILAHRSALDHGKSFEIPDFRQEEARKQYENDRLTPFYGTDGSEPNFPCCSHPDYKPTAQQIAKYHEALGD